VFTWHPCNFGTDATCLYYSLFQSFASLTIYFISYRVLRSYFADTHHWRSYDPFFAQKLDVFKRSGSTISRAFKLPLYLIYLFIRLPASLVLTEMAAAIGELENSEALDSDKLGLLFNEILQMCLWSVNLTT
jgi:hypothetical protein